MSFLSVFILLGSFAHAQVLPGYNAIRCRRPNETSTAVHIAVINHQPDSMYWIENDRVQVLSNDVSMIDSTITALGLKSSGKYVLNYASGDFTTLNPAGTVVSHEVLSCELCPDTLDYCPGDAPGNGTNVPPVN